MGQTTFSVRMDESLKNQFDNLCKEFGMNASTAFNIFARAVVRERKIPFEISAPIRNSLEDGHAAFHALRLAAKDNHLQDMSLDEINEEIRLARDSKE
mgnify:CR=1 FL=1